MDMLLRAVRRFSKDHTADPTRLILLTDQKRGYDFARQLMRAPKGCLIIERTFGTDPTRHIPSKLKAMKHLATIDQTTARQLQSVGIHWPEQRLRIRKRSAYQPHIETASAHSGLAVSRALAQGIDRILLSAIFRSDSPSAGRPLGTIRTAILARSFPKAKLYALGGIKQKNVAELTHTGVFGIAGISFDPRQRRCQA
jgi:thiamine-phosphate pyrophosphorylase